ncbi:MAG TPA: hypothetical protein VFB90_08140, partial [Dehalococcoidia bacterium]|nr:hypothetical protein [Dehalococcoidia bacterium]
MAEIFSGFVIGYALSLLFTALAAISIIDMRQRSPFLQRAIAPNINFIMLTVPVSMLAFLVWTAFGMMMGLFYKAAEAAAPAGSLGSPNGAFTIAVVILGAVTLGVIYYAFERRPAWRVIAFVTVTVALFGWAMPYLSR